MQQGLLVVMDCLLVILGDAVYVAQSIVGTIVAGVNLDAFLEPEDRIHHVVLIVVGDPQSIMRVVVVRRDLDAPLVPKNRLIEVTHLIVDAP